MINEKYFKRSLACCLSLVLLLGFAVTVSAKSIAILTSGGDRNSTVDEWRNENIQVVEEKLNGMGITDCRKAFDKETFKKHIDDAIAELTCGDTLVLYFNGHGDDDKVSFVFDRASHTSANRFLSIRDVRNWLSELQPCVKVYIAIHSCYSGFFIKELEKDPHVVVAVSSAGNDVAHKYPERSPLFGDYVNWRNWPHGFAAGLGGENLADAFQKGARNGDKYAMATGGNKREPFRDNPQDFKRGHLENVERTGDEMRCTLKVGDWNVTVIIPRGKATNIPGLYTSEFQPCFDIEVSGKATFTEDGFFKPTRVNVIKFKGKFHVVKVSKRLVLIDKKRVYYLRAHMFKPDGLKNSTQTIYVDKDDPVWKDMEVCQWYTFDGEVFEGSNIVGTNLERAEPEPCTLGGHVESVDKENRTFKVAIDTPADLKGNTREAAIKEGEDLPSWLQGCLMVDFEGIITKDTLNDVIDIRVREESFYGIILSIDEARTMFTVRITTDPYRYARETKEVEVRTGKTVPERARPGMGVYFHGKCYGQEVNDAHDIHCREEEKTEKKLGYGMNIKSGWTSWGPGDFAASQKTLEHMGEYYPCIETVQTKEIGGSVCVDVNIQVAYHLTNSHTAGINLGYRKLPGGTFEQAWSTHTDAVSQKMKLSASEIPLEFFYKMPIKKGLPLFVTLTGGFSFCSARLGYDYNLQYSEITGISRSSSLQNYFSRGNLKDSIVGLNFSLGAEYSLNKKMALSFGAGWALARFKKLTGTLIDRFGNSTESLLTMEDNSIGELLGHRSLADLPGSAARPAIVDLSGMRFSLGFQYLFDIPFLKKKADKKPEANETEVKNKEPEIR